MTSRTDDDRSAILCLFEEPDFYFGTYLPDLLGEAPIDALAGPGTLVCRAAGQVAGLMSLDPVNAGYPGHLQMRARFARRVGAGAAAATITATLDGYAARRPLRRVSHDVYGFDDRGLAVARQAGFGPEGILPAVVQQHGQEFGVRCLARMFTCPGWPLAAAADGSQDWADPTARPAGPPGGEPARANGTTRLPRAAGADRPAQDGPGAAGPPVPRLHGFRAGHLPLLRRAWQGDDLLTTAPDGELAMPVPPPGPPGCESSRLMLAAPGAGVVQLSEIEQVHRTARLTVASLHPLTGAGTAGLLSQAIEVAFGRLNLHRVFGYQPVGSAADGILAAAGLSAEAGLPGHGWAGGPVDRLIWGRCAP